MSLESHYLRKKIKYHLTRLEQYTELDDIPDDRDDRVEEYYSNVEIKVIEICSLMRKLDDLGKLPDGTLTGSSIKVLTYQSNGADSQRPYVSMEKEYDLSKPTSSSISLRTLCDIVIHSYVLQATGSDDKEFFGIFITSDYKRLKELYMVELKNIVDAFRKVVDLYPSKLQAYYDHKKQSWVHKRLR